MMHQRGLAVVVTMYLLPWVANLPAAEFDRQVEADWLLQARVRAGKNQATARGRVSRADDAAGAVDGVKNGRWGFHTLNEANPWWQVDLGGPRQLARVVLYNRCDGGAAMAGRTARFVLLLSADGKAWRKAYQHNGKVFFGFTDNKPLHVALEGEQARFVRVQLPYHSYFHLDEVEVYAAGDAKKNIALGRPADQSSTSQWSTPKRPVPAEPTAYPTAAVIERGRRLAADLEAGGVDVAPMLRELQRAEAEGKALPAAAADEERKARYFRARRAVRRLALSNPLLDFARLLVTKRVPGTYSHMSDQYYGWWSRPGGGIYVLTGFRGGRPKLRCLTDGFEPGSFLRPDVSYDGTRLLFAYCKHYPHVGKLRDKVTKAPIPEDAFYQLYEMPLASPGRGGARRLTRGRYDDFDGRYLPDGRIAFLSTRRGQFFQCGRDSAAATLDADLPDSYVRCGGGAYRPVAIYALHTMASDGSDIRAISAFENFEWTPSVANDGRILYARWDYVDRHNNAYMSLWSTNPDGTNPQGVYGNFTRTPHCIFEARCVPNSNKILFTASGHHSITGGSIVLLDPDVAQDGFDPITRLTPEVCFPEIEGWPTTYYANPYPLSETYALVCWSPQPLRREGGGNPANALGVYLMDAFGNLELLCRDPDLSTMYPLPIRPRPRPPVIAQTAQPQGEGRMFLVDVYQGLPQVPRGTVKRLRIVGVPAKVQPQMNRPVLGITREDPGKCVLGTVPVEADGSAHFRIPAGVNVFFQALDAHGRAVQTMRTVTYVQPGQTLSCIGCHEPRNTAPPRSQPAALARAASKLTPAPDGAWPLRYGRLVQPLLERHCVRCHKPGGKAEAVAKLDLSPGKSYAALLAHDKLGETVRSRYLAGQSRAQDCIALASGLCSMFLRAKPHQGVRLDAEDRERLVTWLDTYAQKQGSFSEAQEQRLAELREQWGAMIAEKPTE